MAVWQPLNSAYIVLCLVLRQASGSVWKLSIALTATVRTALRPGADETMRRLVGSLFCVRVVTEEIPVLSPAVDGIGAG